MNNWQKVINVSLAVIVTLLIYQNQQLQKEVDTLEQVGLDIQLIKDRVGIKPVKESEYGGEPVYWTVNERLTSYGLEVLQNQSDIASIKQLVEFNREDIEVNHENTEKLYAKSEDAREVINTLIDQSNENKSKISEVVIFLDGVHNN